MHIQFLGNHTPLAIGFHPYELSASPSAALPKPYLKIKSTKKEKVYVDEILLPKSGSHS